MAKKIQQQLKEVGSKLQNPPTAKDALIKLLKQAATCLSELDQSQSASMLKSMQPFFDAIAKPELLKHQDRDVRLLVATCVCEITRIIAPEAPYSDDVLKDIFHLVVGTFGELSDTNGPSFGRIVVILETIARYRSCIVMLDLECYDLIKEMFSTFFDVVSDEHPENVLTSMQTIMVVLLEESEDIREDLLLVILSNLGREKNDTATAARKLAMNVIEHCAGQLEPGIQQFLILSMSEDGKSLDNHVNYHEVIYEIYRCAPQILLGVIPYLTRELLMDQLDTRLKAVKLVGDLFALPGTAISEAFQPIFSEFLKRLTDRVVAVRMSVLEQIKSCLLSNPYSAEAPQIICALCDRLLDYDENIRKQAVAVICDVACHSLDSIPAETAKQVAERLRDKSLLVKTYTMERLADMYRLYCLKCSDDSINPNEFDWIPGKILRCFYDNHFRSVAIESVLSGSLFPNGVSTKDKVKRWVRVFAGFDKIEVKALDKLLEQKQRLQQEMQRYLSLRQMSQCGDAPEIQKKILFSFRIMSRWFPDSLKAEEQFQILDKLKDDNIWKILTSLLDINTGFQQASTYRDDLLRILGEKHCLYEFLSALSMECSYLLFNKEDAKELLLEVAVQKSAGNGLYISSCMNILVILASFSPLLLGGIEEDLVNLLKDDNEIIKEGVLHVMARAGGTIREQLAVLSSPVDLTLERLCLEGSRKQAKYAVHALAAITKDDGLKSLSVLYKRLVDMLEEKTHLPAVLQSLGCIAQTAVPVFETREREIEDCIKIKILECNNKANDNGKAGWDDRSELCSLKIFGIKTLVKSYLPVKDAHLRLGIDRLFHILKNILLYGEISKDTESSSIDKAHLRLASAKAILRLSRHWDNKISVDIFHLTLKTSEINFPQVKKLFLSKIHQYIKDQVLDAKYACAFLINIIGSQAPEFEEDKHNLGDIIQMCYQAKACQLSTQNEANSSMVYPEYILPYLVHALAHHSCPDIDECKDVHAFEDIYRLLHLFLSMLVHGDGDGKSEGNTSKENERTAAISSIFQSIKQSEDIVDMKKSKNSHALCDLGLSIIKRLAQKEDDLPELTSSISLPSILYRIHEKKEEEDSKVNEGQTWLAEESVVMHFESLKIDTNVTGDLETPEDDGLKDTERDGSEVPLGKIVKHLKSKGTKGKKVMKKKSLPVKAKHAESDVDIMKMVRQINLDNVGDIGVSSMFEPSNGDVHAPSIIQNFEAKHQKRKRTNASESNSVTVPKRRRSSYSHNAHKVSFPWSSSKGPMSALKDDLHQTGTDSEVPSDSENKMSMQKDMVDHKESGFLVSCLRKSRSPSSKRKGRWSDQGYGGKAHEDTEADNHDLKKPAVLVDTDKVNTIKSKKRKRRSIAGLAKCSLKEAGIHRKELIGCRIKVWWPMDKKFYEGFVKSYDSQQKKHKVLYDDGDMEVLHLDKERWELVDSCHKSKKLNSRKSLKSVDDSPELKDSGGSQQNRNVVKISSSSRAKGKRIPKKKMKPRHEVVSQSNFREAESRENSDISGAELTTTSQVLDVNTGDHNAHHVEKSDEILMDRKESDNMSESVSEGKQVEDTKSPKYEEESDKDEKLDSVDNMNESVSKGKQAEDAKSPNHMEESDKEDKQDSDGRQTENTENMAPDDTQEFDKQEKSHLEEKEVEASSRDPEEASEDQKSVSELDHKTDDPQCSPTSSNKSNKETSNSSENKDAGNSDDETLSIWKRKAVGKSRRAG